MLRRSALATAVALCLPAALSHAAAAPQTLDEVVVTAQRVEQADRDAPYASEVHTREQIERSGAATLYDYLAQHTSVQVLPAYGSRATPLIDLRGYGIGNGYQNIAVTLDGRRLNNIDLSSPLLAAVALDDIERIEITKGSGSVVFGDGATAGAIQITTRARDGIAVRGAVGNHGQRQASLAAGLERDTVSASVSTQFDSNDGTGDPDVTGERDASTTRNTSGSIEIRPLSGLSIALDGSRSRVDTRYISALTLAQYRADPTQNGGNTYNHQILESDVVGARAGFRFNEHWRLSARLNREEKLSDYRQPFAFKSEYDYRSSELALDYRHGGLSVTAGMQGFDGERIGTADHTFKDNLGAFVQSQFVVGNTTFAAGVRRERVEYTYAPTAGASLSRDEVLTGWDLGINQRVNDAWSLFANINRAFQAPDIDRFFNFGGTFNAFIDPAISHTVTTGFNHFTPANRLKFAVFYARLRDEIYFEPFTFTNTNIDRSHKYGVELQDQWQLAPDLLATLNYTFTRAIIDHEDRGAGSFDGKDLPGVPRHGVNLGLDWQVTPAMSVGATQVWRSEAYSANDFANAAQQRQQAYRSTGLAWRYQLGHWQMFAAVDNLFAQRNGIWIQDDVIYPVNFARLWRVGIQAKF